MQSVTSIYDIIQISRIEPRPMISSDIDGGERGRGGVLYFDSLNPIQMQKKKAIRRLK
jgi:hypothetical protein